MTKATEGFHLGDRVKRGTRTGVVTMGRVPVRPEGFQPAVPLEHMVRIRWDGHTFSTIEDGRGLSRE